MCQLDVQATAVILVPYNQDYCKIFVRKLPQSCPFSPQVKYVRRALKEIYCQSVKKRLNFKKAAVSEDRYHLAQQRPYVS